MENRNERMAGMSYDVQAPWPEFQTGAQDPNDPDTWWWCEMRGQRYLASTPRGALMMALNDWLTHPTAGA
jgi:hypothetical protein